MQVVFVHGACVRDGAWWWHRAAALLADHGVGSVSPGLPSCGEAGRSAGVGGPGLTDDVEAVRGHLLGRDEPTIVVAHSYGGIVAAEAIAGADAVRALLLISSYLPLIGQGLADFGDDAGPAAFLDFDAEGGTFGVRPDALADVTLHDCDAAVQAEAPSHVARQSLHVIGQPVGAAGWQEVPTTYLVCTEDRATAVARQRRYAERADTVVELDAGHHPFLSRPHAVAELVLNLSTAV